MRVPGFSGAKLFLLHTGMRFSTSGASVRGMQHLGAVVGQLGGFGVGDFVEHLGVGHQARVGAHDAIDVGPDPQLGGVERGGQDGRREIRAAAARAWWGGRRRWRR